MLALYNFWQKIIIMDKEYDLLQRVIVLLRLKRLIIRFRVWVLSTNGKKTMGKNI
jgi:hypothetical protein